MAVNQRGGNSIGRGNRERRTPIRHEAVEVQAFACSDGTLERELQRAGPEAGVPTVVVVCALPKLPSFILAGSFYAVGR
jgi:hypothetical protein